MNRRQLLTLAAALAGSPLAAALPPALQSQDKLRALFTDKRLREIGKQCLAILPADQDVLARSAGFNGAGQSDARLLNDFATKRKADFRTGRIHTINGWVMAEAECALCALLALS